MPCNAVMTAMHDRLFTLRHEGFSPSSGLLKAMSNPRRTITPQPPKQGLSRMSHTRIAQGGGQPDQ